MSDIGADKSYWAGVIDPSEIQMEKIETMLKNMEVKNLLYMELKDQGKERKVPVGILKF